MRFPLKPKVVTALAAGLLLIACGNKAAGQRAETAGLEAVHFPAPDFPKPGENVSGTTWINSPPLTLAGLRGKVVLVDFWEYTCINCIRTFATNKLWYERYHRDGFEIVGVHAPEFDIAYKVENVRAAVGRFGLPYPEVVDDWFTIWKSYRNTSWPGRYLIDARGIVRFKRLGEGADDAFERAIRELLREAHPGLKFPAEDKIAPEPDAFSPHCGIPTPEMYVGPWYGRGVLVNPQGYHEGKTTDYRWPGRVGDGGVILSGKWEANLNGMIYRGPSQEPGAEAARLAMRYHARELYAVLNVSHGRPSRLYLLQDGRPLTSADKGADVRFDSQGHSYIDVGEPRMYYLVANPSFSSHTLTLIPAAPGLTVNSFTFGNNCQTDFPHL
jgi:thiol-disulfide isomerase/thioredoxin